ncbi:hypothetical protein E2542_SST09201 [Spatholobus suberectus]|nr:hypothetical protein E2542_SST09201 [Spatholobus suberectus]
MTQKEAFIQSLFVVVGEVNWLRVTRKIVLQKDNEGEIKERPMTVKEIYKLPLGEKIVIPFEGNQPSGEDADGLLGGFLGRLAKDNKLSFQELAFEIEWATFIDYRLKEKTKEKIAEIESQGTVPVEISSNDSLGLVLGKEHLGRVRGEQSCVQELKNEVQGLRSELKATNGNIKTMAIFAQMLTNSTMPVPPKLLDVIQQQQQSFGGSSLIIIC